MNSQKNGQQALLSFCSRVEIKSDLDNDRGITLLSIFGKLFLGILLERLTSVLDNFKILEENQIAYRKGYQTSDHLLTFISIIQNAFKNNSSLYVCFVDFKKAFDSVDHSLLMKKLIAKGITGKFYKIVSTLYAKVKSCARANDGLTNFFSCSRGVRQGCLLSPMLFTLFLNDLNAAISSKAKGISLGSDVVHTLLYADDLVLVAETPEDLQTQLDVLKDFTENIMMKVNIGKTKVMVLRKNKRKSQSQKTWFLGEQELKECDSYKCLGVTIKSNGSFNEHIENMNLKAGKAYYALISKCKDFSGLQPRLFLYLFDQTIVPILNYASEIWGFEEYSTLERLHLSACKYILGVKSTTCTDAVYAELGRISLQSIRHACMLKFFARLLLLNVSEPHRLVCKSFRFLCDAADLGFVNWVSRVRELQARYDILPSDNVSDVKSKVRHFFENHTMSNLNEHLVQDKKLCTYAQIKSVFKFETYLDVINDFKKRQCFSKFQMIAHNLEIEAGRFGKNRIPRSGRHNKYCLSLGKQVLGDEIHFVMMCPQFHEDRQCLETRIVNLFPNVIQLSVWNKFIWLLSQEDKSCLNLVANFLSKCFRLKSEFSLQ